LSENKKIYKQNPKHRLIDHQLPQLGVLDSKNPVVPFMRQNPEFGWNNPCVPSRAGRKVNEWIDGQGKFNLLQDLAHAKRWIIEQIGDKITCYLPTWARKPKLAVEVIKLARYIRRLVMTYTFWRRVVDLEIAMANHYINQANAVIDYAENTLSPAGLRAEWENEVLEVWNQARSDNLRQITENEQSKCLI
jgi:hypothetical protein